MRILPTLLAAALLAVPAHALLAPPQVVPVDRLVQTAEKAAKEHPESAESFHTLARIHYLAFSTKRDQVAVQSFKDGEAVNVGSRSISRMFRTYNPPNAPKPGPLSEVQVFAHATAAKENYLRALKIDAKNPLYHLNLATVLDEARTWAALISPGNIPLNYRAATMAEIRQAYGAAFDFGLVTDKAVQTQPPQGLEELISYEAAQALVRLADAEPDSLTAEERRKVEEAKAAIDQFHKLPRGLRFGSHSLPGR